MQKFTNVRSTAETVQPMETDDYHVILNNGITEIHEEGTEEEAGFNGWQIEEQLVYEKDEYIRVISEKNSVLEQQATDLQLALAEVYEMML